MVIKLKTSKRMKDPLTYNEKKIASGDAKIILASGFGCDVNHLGFSQKLKRFELNINQNPKIKTRAVHISINFLPEDKISQESMTEIARKYLDRLGFAEQPYLVYQHFDANHPHIHIVTTPIQQDGKPIYMHNIIKRIGEPVRQELENEYHLIKAKGRNQNTEDEKELIQSAIYGRIPTKKAINKIVSRVIGKYKFTNLEEFNAILRQKNIVADPGISGGIIEKNKGLQYFIVDNKGRKISKGIKASSLFGKPTLYNLSKIYLRNGFAKNAYQETVRQKIHTILNKSFSIQQLNTELKNKNIDSYITYDRNATITSISFIDKFSRTVYNSNELGLSPQELTARLKIKSDPKLHYIHPATERWQHTPPHFSTTQFLLDQLTALLTYHHHAETISPEFLKRKKKKRRI